MKARVRSLLMWGRELYPVRVWIRFLNENGLILAAGMSYQALFAVFAAVYIGFSFAGIWLSGRPETLQSLGRIVNTIVPDLIGTTGAFSVDELLDADVFGSGFLTWTGAIAVGGLVWTAIGWITYSRISVRAVLGLEKDRRNYFLMKARDLLVAVALGSLLLVAATLSVASTAAFQGIFELLGVSTASLGYTVVARSSGLVLVFAINTLVLAMTFRFLSRAAIPWRRMWGGSTLGGVALLSLQLGGSLLTGVVSRNPLMATFAVFVGLLLFFRLTSIVTLVSATWIAVGAQDREEPLLKISREETTRRRENEEQRAVLLAAQVRVRNAQVERDSARWYQVPAASAHLRSARAQLDELKESD
jgi:membrane protein